MSQGSALSARQRRQIGLHPIALRCHPKACVCLFRSVFLRSAERMKGSVEMSAERWKLRSRRTVQGEGKRGLTSTIAPSGLPS